MPTIKSRPVALPPNASKAAPVTAPSAPIAAGTVPAWSPVRATTPAGAAASVASPAEVATAFYKAFQTKDVAAFEKLYAPTATFKDPIYELNNRAETLHMWKTLFKAGTDLKLSFKVLESGQDSAKVSWTADYQVFGRPVHNEAVSELQVKDGKITQQRDTWSWSKWARQALPLGPLVDVPPVKAILLFVLRNA